MYAITNYGHSLSISCLRYLNILKEVLVIDQMNTESFYNFLVCLSENNLLPFFAKIPSFLTVTFS